MNTNPSAIKVLCFGDSNTFGRNPSNGLRYDAKTRWTGILQDVLGTDYYVIEEGLGGRTTNLDESGDPTRNGLTYFRPALLSHEPDVLIVMLGTNDLKDEFNRNVEDISNALEGILTIVKNDFADTKVILVSPTGVDTQASNFTKYADRFSEKSASKGKALKRHIERLASRCGVLFLDAASLVELGEEGLHWTKESHARFGKALAEKVKEES